MRAGRAERARRGLLTDREGAEIGGGTCVSDDGVLVLCELPETRLMLSSWRTDLKGRERVIAKQNGDGRWRVAEWMILLTRTGQRAYTRNVHGSMHMIAAAVMGMSRPKPLRRAMRQKHYAPWLPWVFLERIEHGSLSLSLSRKR